MLCKSLSIRVSWIALLFFGVLATCLGKVPQPSLNDYEVPFRMSRGYFYIQLYVGSKPRWFSVDSGCWTSLVDPDFARQVAGVQEKRADFDTLGNTAAMFPRLQVGNAVLADVTMCECRLRLTREMIAGTSDRVVGVLGYSALRLLSIGIDFKKHQAWVWPANTSLEARNRLFGPSGGQYLSGLKSSQTSGWATCALRFGDDSKQVGVDLGSFVSSFPRKWVHNEANHILLKPEEQFALDGVLGKESVRIAIADRFDIGPGRWNEVPIAFGADTGDVSVLGWTVFAPLGRVLFDFADGAIYCSPIEKQIGLFDTVLGALGTSIEGQNLLINDHTLLPINSIRSIFDLPVSGTAGFSAMESRVPLSMCPSLFTYLMTYHGITVNTASGQKLLEHEIIPDWAPNEKPRLSLNSGKASPIKVPGYYLFWNGHTTCLPAGDLFVPSSMARVIAAGGVPDAPKARLQSGYFRFRIPKVLERSDTWGTLGWSSPVNPFIIGSEGSTTPCPFESTVRVPPNSAIALGNTDYQINIAKNGVSLRTFEELPTVWGKDLIELQGPSSGDKKFRAPPGAFVRLRPGWGIRLFKNGASDLYAPGIPTPEGSNCYGTCSNHQRMGASRRVIIGSKGFVFVVPPWDQVRFDHKGQVLLWAEDDSFDLTIGPKGGPFTETRRVPGPSNDRSLRGPKKR
jgi:hypothetical protein